METTAFSHLLPIRRLLSFSSAGCKGLPPPFRRDLHAVKRLKGRLDQVGCGVRTALSCSTGKERSSRFFADTRGIITHEGGEGGRGDKKPRNPIAITTQQTHAGFRRTREKRGGGKGHRWRGKTLGGEKGEERRKITLSTAVSQKHFFCLFRWASVGKGRGEGWMKGERGW